MLAEGSLTGLGELFNWECATEHLWAHVPTHWCVMVSGDAGSVCAAAWLWRWHCQGTNVVLKSTHLSWQRMDQGGPSGARSVLGITCVPGTWAGNEGCFDSLLPFLFPYLWGWQLTMTWKMRARKHGSHGCCREGGRQRCRRSAVCPRAFCRLVLPW